MTVADTQATSETARLTDRLTDRQVRVVAADSQREKQNADGRVSERQTDGGKSRKRMSDWSCGH